MLIVALAWIYVALMMAVAEATSSQGSVLGAIVTFVLYGVLPLSVLLYIMATPARRAARRRAEADTEAATTPPPSTQPDGSGHAAADAVAAERKEP